MAENTNIDKGLKEFGQDFVLSLAFVLRKLDKRASGKLISTLNYDLVTLVQDINYKIEIEGESYFDVVDTGRKPNLKQPPLSKIQKWCKLKGINTRLAYPIARNIGKFGIAPSNILEQALNQLDTSKLETDLDKHFLTLIDEQITNNK